MVLCLVFEMVIRIHTLIAIGAGDRVADELDTAVRQGRSIQHRAVLVEDETPERWFQLIAFDDIHQTNGMLTLWQCCCQRHHRVAFSHETHLERFCLVNLCHEITALRLRHHLQRRTCKTCIDLHTREGEARTHRIVKTDTSYVLDMLIRRVDDFSCQWKGL